MGNELIDSQQIFVEVYRREDTLDIGGSLSTSGTPEQGFPRKSLAGELASTTFSCIWREYSTITEFSSKPSVLALLWHTFNADLSVSVPAFSCSFQNSSVPS